MVHSLTRSFYVAVLASSITGVLAAAPDVSVNSPNHVIDRSFGTDGVISIKAERGNGADVAVSGTELLCYTGYADSRMVHVPVTDVTWQTLLSIRPFGHGEIECIGLVDAEHHLVARPASEVSILEYCAFNDARCAKLATPIGNPKGISIRNRHCGLAGRSSESEIEVMTFALTEPISLSGVRTLKVPIDERRLLGLSATAIDPDRFFVSITLDADNREYGFLATELICIGVGRDEQPPQLLWRIALAGSQATLAVDSDGSLAVPRTEFGDNSRVPNQLFLCKVNPTGQFDRYFGHNGRTVINTEPLWQGVTLHDSGTSVPNEDTCEAAVYDQSRRLVLAITSTRNDVAKLCLVRLNADGSPDNTFAPDGLMEVRFDGSAAFAASLFIGADGSLFCGSFVQAPDVPTRLVITKIVELQAAPGRTSDEALGQLRWH